MANGHSPGNPDLEDLLESAMVQDTLFRITGSPEGGVGMMEEASRGQNLKAIGGFVPGKDSIAVAPGAQMERALIHESAHRMDALRSDQVPRELREDLHQAYLDLPEGDSQTLRYARQSPSEHLATTFRQAFQLARGQDLPDEEIPGTQRMLEYLLSQPIFEGR